MIRLAAAGVVAGLIVLALALRGRRVNDHPVCRGCGFDLVGVYPDHAACPECGRQLSGPRAVRVGVRKPRGRMAAIGAVLLTVSIAVGGTAGWTRATGFNWNSVKPVWWLLAEAEHGSPAWADAALGELVRRMDDPRFDYAQAAELVDVALARQADESLAWREGWGDLVESGWAKGVLSPERMTEYLKRAVVFDWKPATRINVDRRLGVRYEVRPGRGGSDRHALSFAFRPRFTNEAKHVEADGFVSNRTTAQRWSARIVSLLPDVQIGQNVIWETWDIEVFEGPMRVGLRTQTKPIATWTVTLLHSFEVLPADQPVRRVVEDPAAGMEVAASLRIRTDRFSDGTMYFGVSSVGGAPNVAAQFILASGSERRDGSIQHFIRPGMGFGINCRAFDAAVTEIDVYAVCRGSFLVDDPAEGDIWHGVIVFEGVPLGVQDAQARCVRLMALTPGLDDRLLREWAELRGARSR